MLYTCHHKRVHALDRHPDPHLPFKKNPRTNKVIPCYCVYSRGRAASIQFEAEACTVPTVSYSSGTLMEARLDLLLSVVYRGKLINMHMPLRLYSKVQMFVFYMRVRIRHGLQYCILRSRTAPVWPLAFATMD